MLIVCALVGLVALVIDSAEFHGEHRKKFFGALKYSNWRRTFHVSDVAVLSFWVVCGISTLFSPYQYEAFWGNEGRLNGFFLTTLYVLFYWLISRFWKFKSWMIQMFLIGGMLVCIIGITDYFKLDLLTLRTIIDPAQKWIFVSTLGNINTYTAYIAMIMGVSTALFITCTSQGKSIWYFFCMAVSFVSIIMGCSDNAYLAIGALFAVLPFFVFQKRPHICRYLIAIMTFASAIQLIDFINQTFKNAVIGVDSLFLILVDLPGLLYMVIGGWILVAGLCFFWRGKSDTSISNRLTHLWGGLILLCLLFTVCIWFDANILENGERYGKLSAYLVFNDSWGTSRGYIWRKSVEIIRDFPIFNKLFGYGPDTFGIYAVKNFRGDMVSTTEQIFDSAHNEYLQFLVTTGILGLTSYLAFLFAAGKEMAENWLKSPYILACLFGFICYSAQAFVNLNLPIVTPFMWMLISMGVAASRK